MNDSSATSAEHSDSLKPYMGTWLALLALTLLEVALGYVSMSQELLMTLLLCLSVVKAALIMAYFMHLKHEKLTFVVTLVASLLFIMVALCGLLPDGLRMLTLGR
ncbi:MAG: cytochrome C oxidase subunit IV family protein [Planctomycetes bacterium]|nr:cytochrome C oxidase subunit IV family protein [Planctomycetota bacterium]